VIGFTTLLLAALSVARLTRLATEDQVLAGPRGALIRRLGVDHPLSYLVTCSWCTSVWISAAVAPAAYWAGDTAWFQVPAIALSASYVAGWLSQFGGE
jgi:hypothetical protein